MVVLFGHNEWEKKKGLPFKKTIRETELTQNLPRALFICARVIVTSLCMAMTKRQDYDVTFPNGHCNGGTLSSVI